MKETDREIQYTSTSNKLYNYIDRLKTIRDEGQYYPINLQISPTEICNLNCDFCSVKNRGQRILSLDFIVDAVDKFKSLGLKSVEITGGGDPTLYPKINELIEYCDSRTLSIGLITNGVALVDKINQENLNRLTWLRISLSALDCGIGIQVPKIRGTLGFSYVWNKKSNLETLKKIYKLAKDNAVKYVRIVPDCLIPEEQMTLRNEVTALVNDNDMQDIMFVQTKEYSIYRPCFIGGLKPFLYTDGYLYHCSACALYERAFTEPWRICHASEIFDVWPDNFKPADTSRCEKGKCFYFDHNKILTEIQGEFDHEDFI